MELTKRQVRDAVEAELIRRWGYGCGPTTTSNKDACKLFGLIPKECMGIGSIKGGKILKAWAEKKPIPHYESLGGFIREQQKPSINVNDKKAAKSFRKAKETFFASDEWRAVRYQALRLNGAKCQCCGRGRIDGVIIHVDHIKPRSKFPHLALELTNLQVLCEDCNLGKSNRDATDWRGDGARIGV